MSLDQDISLFYTASKKQKGVVIGIPGLTHHTEETRLTQFLRQMTSSKFSGLIPHSKEVHKKKEDIEEIICDLTPKGHNSSIKLAFEASRDALKERQPSVIVSSIGAWYLALYLADNPQTKIDKLIMINPVTCCSGIKPGFLQNLGQPDEKKRMDITTENDRKNDIRRYLTENSWKYFQGHSPYNLLRRKNIEGPNRTLTFVSENDEVATSNSMQIFHDLMKKNRDGEIVYLKDTDHNIPYSFWAPKAKKFLEL